VQNPHTQADPFNVIGGKTEPFVDPDPEPETFRTQPRLRSKQAEGLFGESIVDIAPCHLGKDDYFKSQKRTLRQTRAFGVYAPATQKPG